jgi:hypothetical protein
MEWRGGLLRGDGGRNEAIVFKSAFIESGYHRYMETVSGHPRIDERSLALHRAVADKLRKQPELLQIAHDNLARWRATSGRSRPWLDEWQRMLDGPTDTLLAAMESDEERMTALRQSSPFAGVLSPRERWAIYERFENTHQVR